MQVVLGLGSNLGDRKNNLLRAVELITDAKRPLLRQRRISSLYECPALLPPGAPASWNLNFYNAAVRGESMLAPEAMLEEIKAIESDMGRVDEGRWGPRIIDIDILAWGEEAWAMEGLSIPHPGLLQRDFALAPLAELWPAWRHPDHPVKTAQELAAALQSTDLRRIGPLA